jgi:hypothetical protein
VEVEQVEQRHFCMLSISLKRAVKLLASGIARRRRSDKLDA